jgi:hypothetical protein
MDRITLAGHLLELMAAEKVDLTDDLEQAEKIIRQTVLEIGAKALELHLGRQPLGYEGGSRACDECDHNQKFVAHRPRTLATLMGQVTFQRAYYHCRHCGSSCCPYDQRVGLGSSQESPGLAKAAALLAAVDPFIPAATLLADLTGQKLGDRTVHRIAQKVGKAADDQERSAVLSMATWAVPADQVEATPRRLYVAVDGVMVHRRQWNEAKCVCCYWEEEAPALRRADLEPDKKPPRYSRYCVRFESAESFKAFVWSLAMRCGLERAVEVVLLGDGAAWIWEHIAPILGERTVCITDWYHVMEHLWTCGNTLFGQGSAETAAWVQQREKWLWEGRWQDLIADLQQHKRQQRSLPRREALGSLITYLSNQGARLDYARFRAMGLDIGSGRVESACKHVVQNRMKRSGMIWSDPGAQQILSLRNAYLNGHWDALWSSHPMAA